MILRHQDLIFLKGLIIKVPIQVIRYKQERLT